MRAKKTLKKIVSGATTALFAITGVVGMQTPAQAAACGGGTLPSVELVSDPVFYSGLTDGYDANYIAYKITGGSTAIADLKVRVENFTGGRITLASAQPATQNLGSLSSGNVKYSYFLAKMTGTATTTQAHEYVILDGTNEMCRGTTPLNASTINPAGNKNSSNKVTSISMSAAPTTVPGTITVTVKGETGQIGASEGLALAPVSSANFPADKWELTDVTVKLKQDRNNVDISGTTQTFTKRLYFPVTGIYSGATTLQDLSGPYTAEYVFKLVAATGASTVMKPIQYVGNVYTGTMPTATATIAASGAAASAPAIVPATQAISALTGSLITASSAFTASGFSASPSPQINYSIDPSLSGTGLTFNTSTGVISGTPVVTISRDYLVTATNTAVSPNESTTATVTISVTDPVQQQNNNNSTPELDRKVTICHRTHATNNPYVRITVDYNSVNKSKGHMGHDEIFQGQHVYTPGIYKRAKDKLWGDIIPPDRAAINAGVTPRWQPLNWNTPGQAIYNGTAEGCPNKFDAKVYYNALREAGVPVKDIKAEIAELEAEQEAANPTITKTNTNDLKYDGTNAKALEEENDKVTICHRTNSTTNPYRRITVAASSIYKNAGHYGHDEIYDGNHVFDSTVNYPANRKDWGDIIPADPTGKNRWKALNWTTLGQAIYNGTVAGCAEQDSQVVYNLLREEGKTKKEIKADLEKQKSVDDDPKEIDEIKYTGDDPEVEKKEPKEPVAPANVVIPDQSLSGIVWLDLNRDGLKDPEEPLMKGVTLTVIQITSVQATPTPASFRASVGDTVKRAATVVVQTDANGFYIFPSLGAGDWQVVTTVPEKLDVTYDSQGGAEGEVITTVPVASHAFTWVGLVGDDPKLNEIIEKAIEDAGEDGTVTVSPNGTVTVTKGSVVTTISPSGKVTANVTDAAAGSDELAATGSDQLAWLIFGLVLASFGAAGLTWQRQRSARTKQ